MSRLVDACERGLNLKKVVTTLSLTPKVFRLTWHIVPRQITWMLVFHVLSSLVPIVQLWLGKMLIDGLIAFGSHAPSAPTVLTIFGILASQGILALLSSGLGKAQAYLQEYVGRQLSLHSDLTLREKLLDLDLATLENPEFLNKHQQAILGAGSKPLRLVTDAMAVLSDIITLLSLGALFSVVKWPITVVLVATVMPSAYVLLKHAQRSYEVQRARIPESRRAYYQAALLSVPQSFKEIKLFQIGTTLLESYRQFKWREFNEDHELAKRKQRDGFISELIVTLGYYGGYAYIIFQALRGEISIGSVVFYSGAFMRCHSAVKGIISTIPQAYDVNVYVKDYLDLREIERGEIERSGTVSVDSTIQTIECQHVSFRYPGAQKWAIQDVSCIFRRGEKIGLVGENGAGKSTLVRLLCRLYDPTEGTIYVNGIPLRDLDVRQWHKRIGAIFQDFVTYYDTASVNIAYGQVEQIHNEAMIVEAAKKAQADGFIAQLPQGYRTIIGREFANGLWLSGGQLQRLALARLFMRDSDLLIMDEPTYALDPRSECRIYEAFKEHCDGKISLLVSHRFSTMRLADRIIVLDGRIVEAGSHEELLRLGGRYAELYNLQSAALVREAGGTTSRE